LISIFSGTASTTKSTSPNSRRGRAGDQAHHLGEARVGLLLGQLLLLDQAGELALGDGAGFLQRGIDELLLDVLDDDGDVGGGDRLCDLAPHGAAADDGGL
jgi:hypothetical protein